MAVFDFGLSSDETIEIVNSPIMLRQARMSDHPEWVALRVESKAHLTRWEPDWIAEELSKSAFRRRLRIYEREHRANRGLALLAFEEPDGPLVGGVTLSHIRMGASCSATVGYWIGEKYLRRGYALAALQGMVRHSFSNLGLHRIEAACQPANLASKGLLEKAGFAQEGLARDFLKINGAWRDHLRFAQVIND